MLVSTPLHLSHVLVLVVCHDTHPVHVSLAVVHLLCGYMDTMPLYTSHEVYASGTPSWCLCCYGYTTTPHLVRTYGTGMPRCHL
jgi:hypothetical protein